MTKVFIVGGPRTGKTTLGEQVAERIGVSLLSTDTWIDKSNFGASADRAADAIRSEPSFVLEGVAVVRALRRVLTDIQPPRTHDWLVVYCGQPKVQLSGGQLSMFKGHETIWATVQTMLKERGVKIIGRARFEQEYLTVPREVSTDIDGRAAAVGGTPMYPGSGGATDTTSAVGTQTTTLTET